MAGKNDESWVWSSQAKILMPFHFPFAIFRLSSAIALTAGSRR
jgi:hypothetical protein